MTVADGRVALLGTLSGSTGGGGTTTTAAHPVAMGSSNSDKEQSQKKKKKKTKQVWRCDVCRQKVFCSIEECSQHETLCEGPTDTDDAAAPPGRRGTSPPEKSSAQWFTAVANKKRPLRQRKDAAKPAVTTTTAAAATEPKKAKTKAARRPKHNDENNQHSLHAFFQGASAEQLKDLQAEQKVAEFQAKRRRQQEAERERRLKRQKAHPTRHLGAVKAVVGAAETAPAAPLCTRFPVPSHVVATESSPTDRTVPSATTTTTTEGETTEVTKAWWNASQARRVQHVFGTHMPWEIVPPAVNGDNQEFSFSWNTPSPNDRCNAPIRPCDYMLQALAALFVPSPSASTGTAPAMDPIDDVGRSPAGQALADFLSKWKDIRQESQRRMVDRHRKLSGRRPAQRAKPAKRTQSSHDDDEEDWFLSGSDSEEDDQGGMTSLFVLTGDVGVGKTSLVYQIAEQAHCGVLEVNTSEVRGAAALRKRIQEVTQTHSAGWNKKASIFSSSPSQENEPAPQMAALTIILLDEVDLMYPDNGDNGFWSALSDVSKKAKAPIVLTANHLPDELRSPVFRFEHRHVQNSIEKCSLFLVQQARREGLVVRAERKESLADDARRIAHLANGDCRRISLAMELLKNTTTSTDDMRVANPRLRLLAPAAVNAPTCTIPMASPLPCIASIRPSCVPADQLSLLTINGVGFLSLAEPPSLGSRGGYPVKVQIGSTDCPHARILNDTMIIAVCPPLVAKGQDTGSFELPWDTKYARVSITSSTTRGILGTTAGMVGRHNLWDGTPWISGHPCHFVEYQLVERKNVTTADSSQDEENEFDDTRRTATTPSQFQPEIDPKAALQLLTEGIDAWLSQRHEIPEIEEMDPAEDDQGLEIIERLCQATALESDAVFFEDCGLQGLPILAGGNIPFEKADKTPVLQFQRGRSHNTVDKWSIGNNSFVTTPSARESRLLKKMLFELRGCPHSFSSADDDDDNAEDPIFRENPEDDALLRNDAPAALLDLPGSIRNLTKMEIPPCSIDLTFSPVQREALVGSMNLLSTFVFGYNGADKRAFFAGLNREMDCLLEPKLMFDARLVLDYLPLIRRMAVMERDFENYFEHIQAQNVTDVTNQGRSTRASTKKRREHYFETAFEFLKSLHDSERAHRVGRSFCEGFLS